MDAAAAVREARRRAGLTQRQLAERAGTSQAAVARYERGRTVPDVATLSRLLEACGYGLRAAPLTAVEPAPDPRIDRSAIRRLLALPVHERIRLAVDEGRSLTRFAAATRRARRT